MQYSQHDWFGGRTLKSVAPLHPACLGSLFLAVVRVQDSPEGRLAVVSRVHTMSKVINKIFRAPQGWIFKRLVLTDISGESSSHVST